jgi:hypothetical protein
MMPRATPFADSKNGEVATLLLQFGQLPENERLRYRRELTQNDCYALHNVPINGSTITFFSDAGFLFGWSCSLRGRRIGAWSTADCYFGAQTAFWVSSLR